MNLREDWIWILLVALGGGCIGAGIGLSAMGI